MDVVTVDVISIGGTYPGGRLRRWWKSPGAGGTGSTARVENLGGAVPNPGSSATAYMGQTWGHWEAAVAGTGLGNKTSCPLLGLVTGGLGVVGHTEGSRRQ
jgi:hypothetical protein